MRAALRVGRMEVEIFSVALTPLVCFFFFLLLSSGMLCPNFTSNDSVLLLAQPSSPPVYSFSFSFINFHTQAPNAKPQSSLPVLCLPSPLPGCTLDRCQPLLLSPTFLTIFDPDLPPSAPFSSDPLPQLMPTLNSFKSAPSLPTSDQ